MNIKSRNTQKSAQPPFWQTCNVLHPWTLFRETAVHKTIKVLKMNLLWCFLHNMILSFIDCSLSLQLKQEFLTKARIFFFKSKILCTNEMAAPSYRYTTLICIHHFKPPVECVLLEKVRIHKTAGIWLHTHTQREKYMNTWQSHVT